MDRKFYAEVTARLHLPEGITLLDLEEEGVDVSFTASPRQALSFEDCELKSMTPTAGNALHAVVRLIIRADDELDLSEIMTECYSRFLFRDHPLRSELIGWEVADSK